MEIFKVIILAIEQGITELLPISSSAHLILTGKLIDLEADTYLLSVLHLGTTLAIIIYFAPILFKDLMEKSTHLFYLKILVSSIPVAIVGLLFQSYIEDFLRGDLLIVFSLIFWGIVMILIEKRHSQNEEENIREISWKQSIYMGTSQILALIPGTSRSGITTIAGVLSGVNKYSALQYSFILGIPVLFGTSIFQLNKYIPTEGFNISHLIGIFISAIFGYLALLFLKRIRKENWLTIFGVYRILLGVILLFVLFL